MPELLFVYGTLRSGFENSHARMLHASASFVGNAAVRGSTLDLGSYPGFRPGPAGEVVGELWLLRDADELLEALDRYEGSEFQRVLIKTIGGDNAWIYQLA